MRVIELIKLLETMPQDMIVYAEGDAGYYAVGGADLDMSDKRVRLFPGGEA